MARDDLHGFSTMPISGHSANLGQPGSSATDDGHGARR